MTEKIKSNGERPQGDLISREALKKSFEDTVCIEPMPYAFVKQIIDNAPTVEPCYQTTSCLDCKNYDKANYYCPRFCEVIREIAKENQRPQGEWIVEKDVYCRCPFCNFKDVKYSNYCPDCGADMRPKPNQLRDCENCVHHSDNGCEVWECEFKRRSS